MTAPSLAEPRGGCDTCGGAGVVAQQRIRGAPGSGCDVPCPDCLRPPSATPAETGEEFLRVKNALWRAREGAGQIVGIAAEVIALVTAEVEQATRERVARDIWQRMQDGRDAYVSGGTYRIEVLLLDLPRIFGVTAEHLERWSITEANRLDASEASW